MPGLFKFSKIFMDAKQTNVLAASLMCLFLLNITPSFGEPCSLGKDCVWFDCEMMLLREQGLSSEFSPIPNLTPCACGQLDTCTCKWHPECERNYYQWGLKHAERNYYQWGNYLKNQDQSGEVIQLNLLKECPGYPRLTCPSGFTFCLGICDEGKLALENKKLAKNLIESDPSWLRCVDPQCVSLWKKEPCWIAAMDEVAPEMAFALVLMEKRMATILDDKEKRMVREQRWRESPLSILDAHPLTALSILKDAKVPAFVLNNDVVRGQLVTAVRELARQGERELLEGETIMTRDMVFAAVSKDGTLLKHFSKGFRRDPEVVGAAITSDVAIDSDGRSTVTVLSILKDADVPRDVLKEDAIKRGLCEAVKAVAEKGAGGEILRNMNWRGLRGAVKAVAKQGAVGEIRENMNLIWDNMNFQMMRVAAPELQGLGIMMPSRTTQYTLLSQEPEAPEAPQA